MIFLVFFSKQTIGVLYTFGILLFELIDIGFNKKYFKNQILKFIPFLIGSFFFILYMYLKGNLFSFFDLCFGSILEFGNSNHSINYLTSTYIFFAICTIIFSCTTLRKGLNLDANFKKNIKFLLCMSIPCTFIAFPLANIYHCTLAITFYYILFIYIIDTAMLKDFFEETKFQKIIIISIFIIFLTLFLRFIYTYFSEISDLDHFDKTSPFYDAPISSESLEIINTVTNYISTKKQQNISVICFTTDAFAYMIPLNLNNNELDLPLNGNFGYNGINKVINKISNMKNTEFLLYKDEENYFWQEPKEVREYIMNNFEKTGELSEYTIYTNK